MPSRSVRISFLAAAVALSLASPAAASSVTVAGGVLVYTAEPGEANETAIYRAYEPSYSAEIPNAAYVYTFDDVEFGAGCAPSPDVGLIYAGVAYLCSGVTKGVKATLGDGNDYLEVDAPGGAASDVDAGPGNDFVGLYDGDDAVAGGEGDDQIYGGHGNDRIDGGPGKDEIHGDYGSFVEGERVFEDLDGAGNDVIDGGSGDDRLEGNGGADVLVGGAGEDTALYNARKDGMTITLDGQANDGAAGENDTIGSDVEGVLTGPGDDTVHGSDGPDSISTGRGKDTVDPAGGPDIVDTGADIDTVIARDGAVDKLGCGDGADSATIDATDVAGSDCEQLDRPASAAAPTATTTTITSGSLELRSAGRPRAGRRAMGARGRLALPAGADARFCSGAAVTLRMTATTRRKRTRRTVTTVLASDCSFSATFKLPLRRGSRIVVRGDFPGTSFLAPARSRTLRLRVGR